MLTWAVISFIVALVAALFGFGGMASVGVGIARVLFFVFLVISVVAFVAGIMRRTRTRM
jgi:uncharacterized membrane protein YtjA (UPF0391 family)